jgi:hypothetical protein
MADNLINHEDTTETIEEAADAFVIQAGAAFYGPFDDDDEAFAWAVAHFTEFNIKAVIAPSS